MEPKPKSDNWVEKNYILVVDSHIARIFKDTVKEHMGEVFRSTTHFSR